MDLLDNAIRLKQEGKIQQAEETFNQLIKENVYIEKCYYHLALIEVDKGNMQEAIKLYTKAIEVKPDYFKAVNNLGLLYLEDKRYKEAIHFFERANLLSPNEINPKVNLALAFSHVGKFANAHALLVNVDTKGLTDDVKETILNTLGTSQLQLQRFDQAYDSFRQLVEKVNPGNFAALTQLSFIALEIKKEYTVANDWVDQALSINPDFKPAIQNKGLIMKAMGKYDEAIVYLQKVIDANPDSFEGYYNLACVYAATRNTHALMLNLQKSLQLAPYIKNHVKQDPDFSSYRNDDWFRELL
jgi:tetratricopeptide (TPR) repeat protein